MGGKSIPKKYQFLLKSDEDKTPAERRWKWVKLEALPDDMRPLVGGKQEVEKRTRKVAEVPTEE